MSVFFESRQRHAVYVKGRRLVGTVLWNEATGSAFVACKPRGVFKITEDEARRVRNLESATETGGRPRLFSEPVEHVLVTMPKRLVEKLRKNDDSVSLQVSRMVDEAVK
jgi:hypothetical protein